MISVNLCWRHHLLKLKSRYTVVTLLMTGVISTMGLANAQDSSAPMLVSAKHIQEFASDGERIRYAALSSDGSRIAWLNDGGEELCLASVADSDTTCYPFAENLATTGRYSPLSWSPDGSTIITSESFFDQLVDSDLWAFDTASSTFTNRTDDGYYGGYLKMPESGLVDYLPTWNPATGDLYFFRTPHKASSNDTLEIELYQLPATGEATLKRDFGALLPVLSVYRPAVVSPDGTRLAFLVLPQNLLENPATGVWILDLETGSTSQVSSLADLQSGLPQFADPQKPLIPNFVQWAGNEALVIESHDLAGVGVVVQNSYYVDLSSETVSAIIDYSDVQQQTDFLTESENDEPPVKALSPLAGIALPDGNGYVYIGSSVDNSQGYVWWQALPPTDEPPTLIATIPDFTITPAADSAPGISADGTKALLFGYLIELGR